MEIQLYKAEERGFANYDWLQANYSFSFANYYNPDRSNFGALRVLNDDVISPNMGFGTHPHHNMEIITIPLKGSLKHKDSMSEKWITLETGEVQVMSAGNGIMHSERNNSSTDDLNLFQIWIMPNKLDIDPSYNQKKFNLEERKDRFQTLVTSVEDNDNYSLSIHQDVRISRIDISKNKICEYSLKSAGKGVYALVISGQVKVDNILLNARDAIGVTDTSDFSIEATGDSELLLIEVPMEF